MPKHEMQKKFFEFSKFIVVTLFVICLVLTFYVGWIMWYNVKVNHLADFTPLAYLVPAWFTAFTTAIGFYYWKAKAENKIKLKSKYGLEVIPSDLD